MKFRFLPALATLLFLLLPGCRQEPPPPAATPSAQDNVRVSWAASVASPASGRSFHLIWEFDLAPGWHLYWNGRNDSGFPPSVKLEMPSGWTAGPLLWPAPERYASPGGILDHVYHEKLVLVQELHVGDSPESQGSLTIPYRVDWLACKDECVPGKREGRLEFPAAKTASEEEIQAVLATLPRPAPPGAIEFNWTGPEVQVQVKGASQLEFFPHEDCLLLQDILADGSSEGDRLNLRLRQEQDPLPPLTGVLHLVNENGLSQYWIVDHQPGG